MAAQPRSVTIIRQTPREPIGFFDVALQARGVRAIIHDSHLLLDSCETILLQSAGLVILGGPMSANDPPAMIVRQLHLIDAALRQGIPLLGVCLGAQLIAKTLGATVQPNPVPELGWYPVFPGPTAGSDPLFRHFRSPETVFQWHYETFNLPVGATWLASSAACPHQAYRYARDVYGIQFHLEVTPQIIQDWIDRDAACGEARELRQSVDPYLHAERLHSLAPTVFAEWLALVA
jgi:GMP synthase-like glutamine amidotransferase